MTCRCDEAVRPDIGGAYIRQRWGGWSCREGCVAVVLSISRQGKYAPMVRFAFNGQKGQNELKLCLFNEAFRPWDGHA